MEAGAYLPRPVVESMMLKTHLKRRFWPVAGRIALRERRLAGGSVLADSSGGRAAPARASCSGSQTEEYGQGVDVLRLQAQALASGGFLEGGQDLVRLSLRRARVPPGTWAGVRMG